MSEYSEWRDELKTISFPHWDDLPDFDLYMDQLVEYINGILSSLNMPLITAAMINNYVKKKVVMAPIKKKYQTIQIADMLIISLMKPVFSLEEIRTSIDMITAQNYPKAAFDQFVDALLERFQGPVVEEDLSEDNLPLQLMRNTASVVYHKMEAEKLLEIMQNTKA